ncbi:MAG: leucine-rich repeat domain-containing protein [Malacoplasma sp.]|nr:leucine-rich repeat domain-containing protein [Mycoplasmataceae bacterium]MDY2887741.1 leucine-rich repeat domain-containing protein [Malacoplasma sp.]
MDSNSTFDFNYLDPKQTKITGVSSKFAATGNLNFNSGKFEYDGIEHVISEITHDAFRPSSTGWYFKKCNLTIPASIKKIRDCAFYGNSSEGDIFSSKEIISINFNEGLEDIGKEAFKNCDDLKPDKLVLPNSLQHIGNNAFEDISPLKELDLSSLDHVINLDANPFDKDGCLYDTNIKTIWVKDQAMKDKYCHDQYWSSVSGNIKIK